jgi:lysine 2,3-aminomutase
MKTNNIIFYTRKELIELLWKADPKIKALLQDAQNLSDAREKLFDYLNSLERHYFNIHSDKKFKNFHIIEKTNAKECIKVLKNLIRTENEKATEFSALEVLFNLAHERHFKTEVTEGFLAEFIFLFIGINARSGITDDKLVLPIDSKKASLVRSAKLDDYAGRMTSFIKRYPHGNDPELTRLRKISRMAILKHFNATTQDWNDYQWHLKHIIQDLKTLTSIVKLEEDEINGLQFAEMQHIPYQITPYYLSLFNPEGRTRIDRAVRAQVLPSINYCEKVLENRNSGADMDFMGERSTSPMEAITRRYPQIVILKPIDTCPQICVYCQRNWEIKPLKESKTTRKSIINAIDWIRKNENISEVLVTGGDPLLLGDDYLESLIQNISSITHIERIRIGTRVLVTLPSRITSNLVRILKKYHKPGRREICVVTHFEHPVEVTSESISAASLIRKAGISIYNQQVFTYYNSARFETSALRKSLKLAGIDPYYTFNTKGKEETVDFRVPIARIEQERKEEARFLPGIIRTDEPVFNVPKLGKSHLRAWQDHELIMIMTTGERVYRFYPWESKVTLVDDYIYLDVPILDYMKKLQKDGEYLDDYKSIWYYF